jgi:segregation and condensation protein A
VTAVETTVETDVETDFAVHLDVFDGPFDLLLGLIAGHQLDITEVALSQVTDEFVRYVRRLGPDLDKTTSFLVVAATLLDLKTARLLPQPSTADPEDLELLEARDLLFARLLQYRAFKAVADFLGERLTAESRRHPRAVRLDERFTRLLPRTDWRRSPPAPWCRGPRRPCRWPTCTRRWSACASRPRCWCPGSAGCGTPPFVRWCPMPRTR